MQTNVTEATRLHVNTCWKQLFIIVWNAFPAKKPKLTAATSHCYSKTLFLVIPDKWMFTEADVGELKACSCSHLPNGKHLCMQLMHYHRFWKIPNVEKDQKLQMLQPKHRSTLSITSTRFLFISLLLPSSLLCFFIACPPLLIISCSPLLFLLAPRPPSCSKGAYHMFLWKQQLMPQVDTTAVWLKQGPKPRN